MMQLVVSCEHATAAVPARFAHAFRGAARALASHRGSDPGALALARQLARAFAVPLLAAPATRLLADPNRSRRHKQLFSEWSLRLMPHERDDVLATCWRPHREAVERLVRRHIARGRTVLHVSVHTFTPRRHGIDRRTDVALLYDPESRGERAFAARWLACLSGLRPELRLRRNFPYRGDSDGLTTHLRAQLDGDRYLGLELEVSQALAAWTASPPARRRLGAELVAALRLALAAAPCAERPAGRAVDARLRDAPFSGVPRRGLRRAAGRSRADGAPSS